MENRSLVYTDAHHNVRECTARVLVAVGSKNSAVLKTWGNMTLRDAGLLHFYNLNSSVATGNGPISSPNMSSPFHPWQILLTGLCRLVNQRQHLIIEFKNAQIDALLNQLGKKRLLLDDDQRHPLAVEAHPIGPKGL